jgi:hypothetical protein
MLQDFLSEKQKKKRKRRQEIFLAVAVVIIVLVMLGFWWLLFRSPILQMRQVVVQGNHNVASGDVVALLNASILKEHNFAKFLFGPDNMLAWPRTIASSDLAAAPGILGITLAKDYWTHTITATVGVREPFAIWCDMPKNNAEGNPEGNEACFWFDGTGTMFEGAFDTEGSALFAIHDYSQGNAALGGKILPNIFVPNLMSILNVLRQSNLDIEEVALQDISLQEIDISTYNGPAIYFSLRFPADEDLSVLQNLMTQPNFSTLQYVDFRVENRAYYK